MILESENDILYLPANGVAIRGLCFRTLAAERIAVGANSHWERIGACKFLAPQGTGLLIEGGSHLVVEGCSFENCALGVRIEDASPAILTSTVFLANTTGLLVRLGCDSVVENNDFADNEGASIEIQADTSARISRNKFKGGVFGIVVRRTSRGNIHDNHFADHPERTGIHFPDGGTDVAVGVNRFSPQP